MEILASANRGLRLRRRLRAQALALENLAERVAISVAHRLAGTRVDARAAGRVDIHLTPSVAASRSAFFAVLSVSIAHFQQDSFCRRAPSRSSYDFALHDHAFSAFLCAPPRSLR